VTFRTDTENCNVQLVIYLFLSIETADLKSLLSSAALSTVVAHADIGNAG